MDSTADLQKLTPFLMFEGQADDAIALYTSTFADASVVSVDRHTKGPAEGQVLLAKLSIGGQEVLCMDSPAHHEFTFTPSVSLFVRCDSPEEIERLATTLSDGGAELMPLGDYGFSTRFAWVSDRFGVSWQLHLR